MAKRIIFCCDGTWQTPLSGTNVYKLYKALPITADQVAFYDDGVGADATGIDHILEGITGEGLLQKILSSYTKIAHLYEPGDQIFLFGFSRGAYTARSLAGFIATCGLPLGTFDDSCIASAFAAYRDPANRQALLAKLVSDTTGSNLLSPATIQMIGVWDTVGALGIPALFGGFDVKQFGFLDTALHPDIQQAFQCLAIDEQRRQFPATLWTNAPAPGQILQQVWFSGCHGDVGGGTPLAGGVDQDTRLSDITLGWMMAQAQAAGLTFDPGVAEQYQAMPAKYALDGLRETWTPVFGPPLPRAIPPGSSLSNSVALRIQYALTYQPPNLLLEDNALADGYSVLDIVDEDAI